MRQCVKGMSPACASALALHAAKQRLWIPTAVDLLTRMLCTLTLLLCDACVVMTALRHTCLLGGVLQRLWRTCICSCTTSVLTTLFHAARLEACCGSWYRAPATRDTALPHGGATMAADC